MIVVDASAVVEVLLHGPFGERIAHRLLDPREALYAPHLIDLEVPQVLRRYEAAGEMSPPEAREALRVFIQMPVERQPHWPFLDRIRNCAATSRLTTLLTSLWRKLWTYPFSPATELWPQRRAIAPS